MFASRVQGAATGLKLEVRLVAPAQANTLTTNSDCQLILVDLQNVGAAAPELIPQVKALYPQAKVVGFGPHVAATMLSDAKAAGCDEVLTRGEFQRQYTDLLFDLAKAIGHVGEENV